MIFSGGKEMVGGVDSCLCRVPGGESSMGRGESSLQGSIQPDERACTCTVPCIGASLGVKDIVINAVNSNIFE